MSSYLPAGCSQGDIDAAAGFSGDDQYDEYCNGMYDADETPDDYEDWVDAGMPEAPDMQAEDEDYEAYCLECNRRKLTPGTYREWINGHDAIAEYEIGRGDYEYHKSVEDWI